MMPNANASNNLVPPIVDATISTLHRRQTDWGLWLQWLLATTIGWTISMLLLVAVTQINEFRFARIDFPGYGAILGGFVGISVGLLQGLVLRQRHYSVFNWIRATVVGCLLGGAIGGIVDVAIGVVLLILDAWPSDFNLIGLVLIVIPGGLVGIVLGLSQSQVLRQQMRVTHQWIFINVASWILGLALSAFIGITLNQNPIWFWTGFETRELIGSLLCAISCGLINGAITGIPLVRMLQNQKSEI